MESLSLRIIREVEEVLSQAEKSNKDMDEFDWSDPRPFNPGKMFIDNLKWPVMIGISIFAVSQSIVVETALILAGATITLRAARSVLQAIDSCDHH